MGTCIKCGKKTGEMERTFALVDVAKYNYNTARGTQIETKFKFIGFRNFPCVQTARQTTQNRSRASLVIFLFHGHIFQLDLHDLWHCERIVLAICKGKSKCISFFWFGLRRTRLVRMAYLFFL